MSAVSETHGLLMHFEKCSKLSMRAMQLCSTHRMRSRPLRTFLTLPGSHAAKQAWNLERGGSLTAVLLKGLLVSFHVSVAECNI